VPALKKDGDRIEEGFYDLSMAFVVVTNMAGQRIGSAPDTGISLRWRGQSCESTSRIDRSRYKCPI
jgi:hypothetical protein